MSNFSKKGCTAGVMCAPVLHTPFLRSPCLLGFSKISHPSPRHSLTPCAHHPNDYKLIHISPHFLLMRPSTHILSMLFHCDCISLTDSSRFPNFLNPLSQSVAFLALVHGREWPMVVDGLKCNPAPDKLEILSFK